MIIVSAFTKLNRLLDDYYRGAQAYCGRVAVRINGANAESPNISGHKLNFLNWHRPFLADISDRKVKQFN